MPSFQAKEDKTEAKIDQTSSPGLKRDPKHPQTKPRYPIRVDELSFSDLQTLTHILYIDNTNSATPNAENKIQTLINVLPLHLRSSFLLRFVPNSILGHAAVCPLHKGMNRHIIRDIWTLIKREVTSHLDIMYAYPDRVGPEEKSILRSLRAISGMWTPPSASNSSPVGAWDFQLNRCEACMLARIGARPVVLRNMRIMLLSRSQMKKGTRAPRLLPWVDAWIAQCEELKMELFVMSGEKAFAMERARKEAAKARYRDRRQYWREERQWKKGNKEIDDFAAYDNVDLHYTASHLEISYVVTRGERLDGNMCDPDRQVETLEDKIDSIIDLYTGWSSENELISDQLSTLPQCETPSLISSQQSRPFEGSYVKSPEGKSWQTCSRTGKYVNSPDHRHSGRVPSSDRSRCSSNRPFAATKHESTRDDSDAAHSQGSWETASISSNGTSQTTWTSWYQDK